MFKLRSIQEHNDHIEAVELIKNREKCIQSILESLDNQAEYSDIDNIMIIEFFNLGRLMKRIFVNPIVKNKIRRLVDQLVVTRVEMIKTQLTENPDFIKDLVNDEDQSRATYDVKVETLQQQQEAIEQKMDLLAGDDDRLRKYVELQKIEARIKANTMIVKIADAKQRQIFQSYNKQAEKQVKELADDLTESVINQIKGHHGGTTLFEELSDHAQGLHKVRSLQNKEVDLRRKARDLEQKGEEEKAMLLRMQAQSTALKTKALTIDNHIKAIKTKSK